jgi:peptidyl-prolyl cis-trans isomerase D
LRIRITREAVEGRLRSWPLFYTDGEFNTTKYNQFVSRTDISWNNLYADLKAQIRREQLLGDVEGGARLSQSEIMNEYRLRNEQVKVRYLALNPSQFENEVAVTEEKLKDYYDKNRMSYFELEKVTVKYVEAKIVPSDSDRQAVRDKARNVLAKAEAGEDFAELAKRYSDAPDASENSGDMGWMEESYLPDAVAAAVAQLENGELSDIVERQQDFYIYKCEGRKEEDGKKKVKLRQVMFKLAAGADTREKIASEVDALLAETHRSGSLGIAAEKLGMEVEETPPFGKGDRFIQGIGMDARTFVNAAFALEKPGDLSYVVITPQAYYLLELFERKDRRLRELSEVKELLRNRVVRQEALVLAHKKAAEIALQITALDDLESVDEKLASSVRISEPFTRTGYVPGVVGNREFHSVAFSAEQGELSEPILGGNGAYFLEVVERIPIDEELYEQDKEKLREQLLALRKQMLVVDWQSWLRSRADIRMNEEVVAELLGG